MITDKYLSKEDTKLIKGIAILWMMIHHLWAFPDRIAGGELLHLVNIFGESSLSYIGRFGKICVSLFFFMGGYGIYRSFQGKEFDLIGKLKKLYISYWKVFLIFIPIGFLFFSNQPVYCENAAICNKYASISWKDFLLNFLGVSCSYNKEWWFFISYVYALVSFPLLRGIVNRFSARVNLFLVMLAGILVTNLLPALGNLEALGSLNKNFFYSDVICQTAPYITSFWMGAVAAGNGLLDRLHESMHKNHLLNPVFDGLIWAAIIFLRQSWKGSVLDMFYIPFLIVASKDFMERTGILRKAFISLGNQSTNMWLIHSFLCYYFYGTAIIVTAPGWAVPSFLVLLLLTYLASIATDFIWKCIGMIYERLCAEMTIRNHK